MDGDQSQRGTAVKRQTWSSTVWVQIPPLPLTTYEDTGRRLKLAVDQVPLGKTVTVEPTHRAVRRTELRFVKHSGQSLAPADRV